jgi:hypothetical protein
LGPWLEIQLSASVALDQFIAGDRRLHPAIHEIERVIIGVARDVVHQVKQSDVPGAGQVGIILRDLVMDGKFAVLGQQEDAGGGELFGDRTEGKHGVGRDGRASRQRTLPIDAGPWRFPIPRQGHGQTGNPPGPRDLGNVGLNRRRLERGWRRRQRFLGGGGGGQHGQAEKEHRSFHVNLAGRS